MSLSNYLFKGLTVHNVMLSFRFCLFFWKTSQASNINFLKPNINGTDLWRIIKSKVCCVFCNSIIYMTFTAKYLYKGYLSFYHFCKYIVFVKTSNHKSFAVPKKLKQQSTVSPFNHFLSFYHFLRLYTSYLLTYKLCYCGYKYIIFVKTFNPFWKSLVVL